MNAQQHAWRQADRILKAAKSVLTLQETDNQLSYLQFIDGCAEPGYDDEPVVLGNWNQVGGWSGDSPKDETICRVGELLEKAGYRTEWFDEWGQCGQCGKAIRTQADSYGWQPYYSLDGGEYTCANCIAEDFDDWIHVYIDNPDRAIPSNWPINIEKFANRIDPDDWYENGFHPGQDDNPKDILESLHKRGFERVVFRLDSTGQFDIRFSAWSVRDVIADHIEAMER
jgi:hypothetical protein